MYYVQPVITLCSLSTRSKKQTAGGLMDGGGKYLLTFRFDNWLGWTLEELETDPEGERRGMVAN
jgi:hypothetical protein